MPFVHTSTGLVLTTGFLLPAHDNISSIRLLVLEKIDKYIRMEH